MSHLDNLEAIVGKLSGKSILDIGAGTGEFLLACAEQGYDATGVEINKEKIEKAYNEVARRKLALNIIHAYAEELPFKDGCFDFVNCGEVIEHVRDPELVLKEIHRVLKPGGKAYISVHNRFGAYDTHFHVWFLGWMSRSLGHKYLNLLGKHKNYKDAVDRQDVGQMHYYTAAGFRRITTNAGFSIIDIRQAKIKKMSFWKQVIAMPAYSLSRLVYFSTFHFLLTK